MSDQNINVVSLFSEGMSIRGILRKLSAFKTEIAEFFDIDVPNDNDVRFDFYDYTGLKWAYSQTVNGRRQIIYESPSIEYDWRTCLYDSVQEKAGFVLCRINGFHIYMVFDKRDETTDQEIIRLSDPDEMEQVENQTEQVEDDVNLASMSEDEVDRWLSELINEYIERAE